MSLDVTKLDLDAKPIENYFFKALYEISFDLFLNNAILIVLWKKHVL